MPSSSGISTDQPVAKADEVLAYVQAAGVNKSFAAMRTSGT